MFEKSSYIYSIFISLLPTNSIYRTSWDRIINIHWFIIWAWFHTWQTISIELEYLTWNGSTYRTTNTRRINMWLTEHSLEGWEFWVSNHKNNIIIKNHVWYCIFYKNHYHKQVIFDFYYCFSYVFSNYRNFKKDTRIWYMSTNPHYLTSIYDTYNRHW